MIVTRRRLLVAAALVPTGTVMSVTIGRLAEAAGRAAGALRPTGAGTSATRCGRCGATDHTMLEPRCPLEPRVL